MATKRGNEKPGKSVPVRFTPHREAPVAPKRKEKERELVPAK